MEGPATFVLGPWKTVSMHFKRGFFLSLSFSPSPFPTPHFLMLEDFLPCLHKKGNPKVGCFPWMEFLVINGNTIRLSHRIKGVQKRGSGCKRRRGGGQKKGDGMGRQKRLPEYIMDRAGGHSTILQLFFPSFPFLVYSHRGFSFPPPERRLLAVR